MARLHYVAHDQWLFPYPGGVDRRGPPGGSNWIRTSGLRHVGSSLRSCLRTVLPVVPACEILRCAPVRSPNPSKNRLVTTVDSPCAFGPVLLRYDIGHIIPPLAVEFREAPKAVWPNRSCPRTRRNRRLGRGRVGRVRRLGRESRNSDAGGFADQSHFCDGEVGRGLVVLEGEAFDPVAA